MSDRILFLIHREGNEKLIVDWVRKETPYTAIEADPGEGELCEADFDLCVMDLPSLRHFEEGIRKRREEARPRFLPFLLLLSKDRDERKARTYLSHNDLIDEAIRVPALKFQIRNRIENLLSRRRDSEQLNRRNEQLEILNRIIRHDIRNDMNLILAYGWELEQDLDGPQREKLEAVLSTGEHVVELTEVARDFVEALETGEPPTLEAVELEGIIRTSVENVNSSSRDADIRLEEVPDVEVMANELLATVFNNLLINGIHHNDKEEPVIRISAEAMDGKVVVSVADNGPGVPEGAREEIFGRGKKGPESEGTGIGLYLVHTLVQGYGGEVWIEDNEPEGAVFKVRLQKA